VSGAGGECRDASERLDSVATLSGEHIEMTVFHCKFWPRSNGRGCYAGRVVGCSQGSSADAIRYPRGMEQSG